MTRVVSHTRGTRRSSAGFTLVELMVALTGGLFISLAVFALARDSGRFYQRETRIANATVGGLLGFERLRTDIARAGFLVSPNIAKDYRLCGTTGANWPAALQNLASIQINTPTITYPALTSNGRKPPSVVLAGSYGSPDMFGAFSTINGANIQFHLGNLTPGMSLQPAVLRLGNKLAPTTEAMQSVFPTKHALRVVQNGRQFYGQIITATGGDDPIVTVNTQPPIPKQGEGLNCGLVIGGSAASRATINVVNFIQYQLGTPQTVTGRSDYADLYASSSGSDAAPGEAGRTELLRLEQDIDGAAIEGSEEIVAEYAVDFNLQLTVVSSVLNNTDPTLLVVPSTDAANFPLYSGPVAGGTNKPELIRSVRVRLGVRSREGDRGTTVASPATEGLFRFDLGTGTSEAFARVRTFQADIVLHNQADILW